MSSSSNDNEDWKKRGRPRNPDGPKEKSLDSRCSPSGFSKIMQEIGENDLKMAEFDLENNLIRDDVGMIDVNASVIECVIGLPSYGYDFPDYAAANNSIAALKLRWGQVTLADLKAFVIGCPMESNEERREFREAFILLLAKSFLCPTTNNFISPERHLPLVVDVANPRRYNCEFENQNEVDYDQEERVQNDSPMTSSQVEREVEADWPKMKFDEELLDFLAKVEEEARKRYASQQKPDVRSAKYHDGPSFSLGPDFNTPTPSPDGPTSKDAEVLDIPPIREILPENIVLNAEEDPCTIRSIK
ncbi:hypothetical protein PIB30_063215 [Stylosanthes scabra]|uniref:Uncharacterized protein n=1 Tax=Stylosanthes scabra TaxID=79078 RepID=A0ABU6ZK22_9FABA|nr:hypothetical protein [Stylosanthes scabra]